MYVFTLRLQAEPLEYRLSKYRQMCGIFLGELREME